MVSYFRSNTLPIYKKLIIVNVNRIQFQEYNQQAGVGSDSHSKFKILPKCLITNSNCMTHKKIFAELLRKWNT